MIMDGAITEYLYQAVQDDDIVILGAARGDDKPQQVFEALALLVALRLWEMAWNGKRVAITVRSDSVIGLTSMLRFAASGTGPAVIAREAAITIGKCTHTPITFEHIAGISNAIADGLSRLNGPRWDRKALPAVLRQAVLKAPGVRTCAWWRSLDPP